MSVIPEKIKSTSKIKPTTSISSESSTTVETVEDEDDAALEKLIDSNEDDLDDMIEYKSLPTVTLPDFVINGIATSDVFGDDFMVMIMKLTVMRLSQLVLINLVITMRHYFMMLPVHR
jgi:hypothetical protein